MRTVVQVMLVILTATGVAHAGDAYTQVIAGCVPVDDAIQSDWYDTGGFGVKAESPTHQQLTFLCPVPYKKGSWWTSWRLTVDDPDNAVPPPSTLTFDYDIQATFYYADAGSNVANLICQKTSSGEAVHEMDPCDFTDFVPVAGRYYFFLVTMVRHLTALRPEALSLRIIDL